jgi:hypothetical protein
MTIINTDTHQRLWLHQQSCFIYYDLLLEARS